MRATLSGLHCSEIRDIINIDKRLNTVFGYPGRKDENALRDEPGTDGLRGSPTEEKNARRPSFREMLKNAQDGKKPVCFDKAEYRRARGPGDELPVYREK